LPEQDQKQVSQISHEYLEGRQAAVPATNCGSIAGSFDVHQKAISGLLFSGSYFNRSFSISGGYFNRSSQPEERP
jgi:hypothetical protein